MKTKTAELTGAALDWLVAQCEGVRVEINSSAAIVARRLRSLTQDEEAALPRPAPYCTIPGVGQAAYSANWAQGGPIIEQEGFKLYKSGAGDWFCSNYSHGDTVKRYGDTPLIAAMRCYVASKLGDEVEIPDELV